VIKRKDQKNMLKTVAAMHIPQMMLGVIGVAQSMVGHLDLTSTLLKIVLTQSKLKNNIISGMLSLSPYTRYEILFCGSHTLCQI
jgi:hypothetical protein